MSGAQAAVTDGGLAPPNPVEGMTPEEVEGAARRLGWKPLAEFRGPPDRWRPAKDFMDSMASNPAMVSENWRKLNDRYGTVENQLKDMKTQLADAVSMVSTLTERSRGAEERAYNRARRELLAERDKAIEEGNVASVRQLDTQVQELDEAKPPPKADPKTTTTTAPPAATTPTIDPEIAAWSTRNPWFFSDPQMAAAANGFSSALRANAATAALSTADHLERVETTIKRMFPEKFAAPRVTPPADPDDEADPPAVETPNSGGAGRTQGQRNKQDFASLPADAKASFRKYRDIIARKVEESGGRVKPLTEAEWARDYYAQ